MARSEYTGPERRRQSRPVHVTRAEIAMRLLITTERLERLTNRLEALVSTPARPMKRDAP